MTDDKDDLIRQLTMRLRETVDENDKLRAENARLRSAEGAHDVLRRLYLDETQSSNVRALAARASLPYESPPLKPVEAPLDLVAEVAEPLSVLVERQRARLNKLLALPLSEREKMVSGVAPGGNGQDDDTGS
jgi:hypothetical protein